MKKSLIILTTLLLAGCSTFSKYSEVEYNNFVAEKVNLVTSNVKEMHDLYLAEVPNQVSEESEIETSVLEDKFDSKNKTLSDLEGLSKLESKNLEQETEVEEKLSAYIEAVNEYYATYEEILSYYKDGAYKEDPTQVKPLDEILSNKYNEFTDTNNELSDTLEAYVE